MYTYTYVTGFLCIDLYKCSIRIVVGMKKRIWYYS